MKFGHRQWLTASLCAGIFALTVVPARAYVIVYTDRSAFLNALDSGYFEDDFQSVVPGTNVVALPRSGNGFTITHSSPNFTVFGTNGGEIGSFNNTGGMLATITTGTVFAVGANFFYTDAGGLFATGQLTITLNQDGLATQRNVNPLDKTNGSFLGFISDLPVISLGVGAGSAGKFTTYDNFIVAVPEPSGLVLLALAGVGAFRRSRLIAG